MASKKSLFVVSFTKSICVSSVLLLFLLFTKFHVFGSSNTFRVVDGKSLETRNNASEYFPVMFGFDIYLNSVIALNTCPSKPDVQLQLHFTNIASNGNNLPQNVTLLKAKNVMSFVSLTSCHPFCFIISRQCPRNDSTNVFSKGDFFYQRLAALQDSLEYKRTELAAAEEQRQELIPWEVRMAFVKRSVQMCRAINWPPAPSYDFGLEVALPLPFHSVQAISRYCFHSKNYHTVAMVFDALQRIISRVLSALHSILLVLYQFGLWFWTGDINYLGLPAQKMPQPPQLSKELLRRLVPGQPFPESILMHRYDFAAYDSGARIVDAAQDVQNVRAVQRTDSDSYLLVPCDKPIWFVIAFNTQIYLRAVSLFSQESYSSTFRLIQIYGSDSYPTSRWRLLAVLSANFDRSKEYFDVESSCRKLKPPDCWVKFLKVQVLETYSVSKYKYCTLNRFQVFGSDVLESLDTKLKGHAEVNSEAKEDVGQSIGHHEHSNVELDNIKHVENNLNGAPSVRLREETVSAILDNYKEVGNKDMPITQGSVRSIWSLASGTSSQSTTACVLPEEVAAHLRVMQQRWTLWHNVFVNNLSLSSNVLNSLHVEKQSTQTTTTLSSHGNRSNLSITPQAIDCNTAPNNNDAAVKSQSVATNVDSRNVTEQKWRTDEYYENVDNSSIHLATISANDTMPSNKTQGPGIALDDIASVRMNFMQNLESREANKPNLTSDDTEKETALTVNSELNLTTPTSSTICVSMTPDTAKPNENVILPKLVALPSASINAAGSGLGGSRSSGPSLLSLVDRVAALEDLTIRLANTTNDLLTAYRYMFSYHEQTLEAESKKFQKATQLVEMSFDNSIKTFKSQAEQMARLNKFLTFWGTLVFRDLCKKAQTSTVRQISETSLIHDPKSSSISSWPVLLTHEKLCAVVYEGISFEHWQEYTTTEGLLRASDATLKDKHKKVENDTDAINLLTVRMEFGDSFYKFKHHSFLGFILSLLLSALHGGLQICCGCFFVIRILWNFMGLVLRVFNTITEWCTDITKGPFYQYLKHQRLFQGDRDSASPDTDFTFGSDIFIFLIYLIFISIRVVFGAIALCIRMACSIHDFLTHVADMIHSKCFPLTVELSILPDCVELPVMQFSRYLILVLSEVTVDRVLLILLAVVTGRLAAILRTISTKQNIHENQQQTNECDSTQHSFLQNIDQDFIKGGYLSSCDSCGSYRSSLHHKERDKRNSMHIDQTKAFAASFSGEYDTQSYKTKQLSMQNTSEDMRLIKNDFCIKPPCINSIGDTASSVIPEWCPPTQLSQIVSQSHTPTPVDVKTEFCDETQHHFTEGDDQFLNTSDPHSFCADEVSKSGLINTVSVGNAVVLGSPIHTAEDLLFSSPQPTEDALAVMQHNEVQESGTKNRLAVASAINIPVRECKTRPSATFEQDLSVITKRETDQKKKTTATSSAPSLFCGLPPPLPHNISENLGNHLTNPEHNFKRKKLNLRLQGHVKKSDRKRKALHTEPSSVLKFAKSTFPLQTKSAGNNTQSALIHHPDEDVWRPESLFSSNRDTHLEEWTVVRRKK